MAPTTTTGSPLSSLGVGGNVTIGASIFYNYRLSARYVQEVQDEAKQMDQLTTQIVESTVGSLQEAALQYDLGVQAEKEMQDVYESKREQYELGLCSFMTVLLARTQTSSASIARIQAMTDLDLLRTTLNRTLILDEFGKVNGCNPTSTGRHQTIDQVCHEGTPLPSST